MSIQFRAALVKLSLYTSLEDNKLFIKQSDNKERGGTYNPFQVNFLTSVTHIRAGSIISHHQITIMSSRCTPKISWLPTRYTICSLSMIDCLFELFLTEHIIFFQIAGQKVDFFTAVHMFIKLSLGLYGT